MSAPCHLKQLEASVLLRVSGALHCPPPCEAEKTHSCLQLSLTDRAGQPAFVLRCLRSLSSFKKERNCSNSLGTPGHTWLLPPWSLSRARFLPPLCFLSFPCEPSMWSQQESGHISQDVRQTSKGSVHMNPSRCSRGLSSWILHSVCLLCYCLQSCRVEAGTFVLLPYHVIIGNVWLLWISYMNNYSYTYASNSTLSHTHMHTHTTLPQIHGLIIQLLLLHTYI